MHPLLAGVRGANGATQDREAAVRRDPVNLWEERRVGARRDPELAFARVEP